MAVVKVLMYHVLFMNNISTFTLLCFVFSFLYEDIKVRICPFPGGSLCLILYRGGFWGCFFSLRTLPFNLKLLLLHDYNWDILGWYIQLHQTIFCLHF